MRLEDELFGSFWQEWAGGIARGIKKYWPYLGCFAAGYITAWIIEIF